MFNRNFGQGRFEVDDDVRAIYAEEPIIVPFRAALEGTRYEGPGALDEFAAASATQVAFLIEVEEGRIAAARTFPSEEAALEAVGR
jgi:hypothetical protein